MVKYCYRKAVNKMGKIIALVNQKGGVIIGFEQDLHFEDRFITPNGQILTKEEFAS